MADVSHRGPAGSTPSVSALNTEIAARAAADAALSARIGAFEAAYPIPAINFSSLITAEASARSAADTALDARITALEATPSTSGTRVYNVLDYGATGDGVTDDLAAIHAAIAAMGVGNGTLYFPPGEYRVTSAIIIDTLSNLLIMGPGATIVHPSADTSLTASPGDAWGNNVVHRRSAFYLVDSSDVWIERIATEGDQDPDIDDNRGVAVACDGDTVRLRMQGVVQRYGSGLISQDATSHSALVMHCYSYASRLNSRLGDDGIFYANTWELPLTSDYDRTEGGAEGLGSSHAIYQFANSGSNISVSHCAFKNMREDGVKMSGSAVALRGMTISHCKFYRIGYNADGTSASGVAVLFGADDNQVHSGLLAHDNYFEDCKGAVIVLGAQGVNIHDNIVHRVTTPIDLSQALISIDRYTTTSQPLEDVKVCNNTFSSELGVGAYAVNAIFVQDVGGGLVDGSNVPNRTSAVVVRGNTGGGGFTYLAHIKNCINPVIEGNTGSSIINGLWVEECRMPRIIRNDFPGKRSTNVSVRMLDNAWPIFQDNLASDTLFTSNRTGKFTVGNNDDDLLTHVVPPLGGYAGLATVSDGRPEVVFAYGSNLTTGDTLNVNGTTYTYGTHFTSFATLVSLLDGLATYTCEDYGTPFGSTSRHLRLRWHVADTTPNLFYVVATCANKTALVVLNNDDEVAGVNRCYSRGEVADTLVVWSPCLQQGDVPTLVALNEYAAACLALGTPYPLVSSAQGESFSDCVLKLGATDAGTLGGTPLFGWRL